MPIVRNGREQVSAEGQHLAGTASQQGQQVVEAASGQAREVAGAVREQATQLGQELSTQGRQLYQETRRQVEDQAQGQTEALASILHRWGSETQALVDGRPGEAGAVGECARQCATKLHDMASGIELRGVDGLIEELQDFGRRRPGAFLLGAALIGFGGGRLLRSGAGDVDGRVEEPDVVHRPRTNGSARSKAQSSRQLAAAGSTRRRNPAASGGE